MNNNVLPFLWSELAYSVIFNTVFGVLFVRKVLKLDKLGDNLDVKIPKRDWLKFSIILLIIFLYLLHLILSYSETSYWLHGHSNFSLVVFLYIGNYTMQSYIVLKLVTKGIGIRYVPNLFFWTFCMLTAVIEAVVIEKLSSQKHYGAILLQALMAILNFSLVIVSLIFDKVQQMPDILRTLRSDSDTGRTIEDSIHREHRMTNSNRLYVEFNQQFQVNETSRVYVCFFKMAVYVDEAHTIITKTDHDFMKLGLEMKKLFPNRQEAHLPERNRRQSDMMKYGEERLKIFENYILDLIKTGEFIVPCLLDFLEVPATQRSKLVMNDFGVTRQQTGDSEEEDKNKEPFFHVYSQRHKIILESPDFVELIVNRSPHEIVQLSNRLKEEKRLTIDILPDNPVEKDFVTFFSVIVNKKSLWRSFASWMRIDIQLENRVYNYFDPWVIGFKGINVDIIGHEVVFDGDGKIHTCYLISLNGNISKASDSSDKDAERGVIIKKRYSEFCILDKHLRKFMSKKKISQELLPPLPPKFSPFGSKTSPKSRQMRFGVYMKGLMKVEGINHCIKLLEFLEFDSINTIQEVTGKDQVEEIVESPKEHSELSAFSEFNQKI